MVDFTQDRPTRFIKSTEGLPFSLLSPAQLHFLPEMEWLIDGVLPANALMALIGPSGTGKTFLALYQALSVACGMEWCGRKTKHGPVLYVMAEGSTGLKMRVSDWFAYHKLSNDVPIWFLPHAVDLRDDEDVANLKLCVERLSPVLIVIDTLARCFPDGDENSARDVGKVITAATKLQSISSASVMIVHHTRRADTLERGSSAFRGAMDAMLLLTEKGKKTIKLSCEKMKESAKFEPMHFELLKYASSCVVIPTSRAIDAEADGVDQKTLDEAYILGILGDGALRHGEWRTASLENDRIAKTAWDDALLRLKESQRVVQEGRLYRLAKKS